LPIYFIINRCRKMFQLILNNRLHLLFLTHMFEVYVLEIIGAAYFKQQAAPIISYTYTSNIASKIFKHCKTLQHLKPHLYNTDNYVVAVLFIILPITYLSAMVPIRSVRSVEL